MKSSFMAVAFITALSCAGDGHAAGLPTPTVFVLANENTVLDDRHGTAFGDSAPVSAAVGNRFGFSEHASSSVAIVPGAVLTTSITSIGPQGESFNASASLTYYFEVMGPSNINIPVNFQSVAYATKTPFTSEALFSEAFFYINNNSILLGGACVDSGVYIGECSFDHLPSSYDSINSTVMLSANHIYDVTLITQSQIFLSSPGSASTSAYIDPYISIDNVFSLNNPTYTLSVSPGVGNVPLSAVPEPASWAMMLLGFCGLGLAVRVRRKQFAQPSD